MLSREQRSALAHVTEGHDLGIVVGYAGSGKSAMLGVAREAWEESGYQVRGAGPLRHRRREPRKRLRHRLPHHRQHGAPVGARPRASRRQGRAGDRRSRHDRLPPDGAGAGRSPAAWRQGGSGRRPRAASGHRGRRRLPVPDGAPCPCRGPGYPPPAGGLAAGRDPASCHRPDRRSAGSLPRTRHGPAGANPG